MAKATIRTNILEPEKVIPAKVEERVVLELSREEADEIFSIVSSTNARNETYRIYQALIQAFTGDEFGHYDAKHNVSYRDSLIQLEKRS